MLVGVSTGVLYKSINGMNQQIDFFRNSGADIDGLEISLGDADMPNCLVISKENEKYLRQLKFISMHLPWKNIEYSNKETPEIQDMSKLYRQLNCRVAVIHPDCVKDIKDYGFLQKLFPGLSVENMTYRKQRTGCSIASIKKITDKYEKLGMVLDFAHCMGAPDSFESYEKAFYEKVTEIHMSAPKKEEERIMHLLLHKTGVLPKITSRKIPLILEGRLSSVEELEKELAFAKRL